VGAVVDISTRPLTKVMTQARNLQHHQIASF